MAIEVLKRADTPSPRYVPSRFRSVTFRIGPTDHSNHGLAPIVKNDKCGEYRGGNMKMVALVFCGQPMAGRFVTMQSSVVTYLEVDEVNILVFI